VVEQNKKVRNCPPSCRHAFNGVRFGFRFREVPGLEPSCGRLPRLLGSPPPGGDTKALHVTYRCPHPLPGGGGRNSDPDLAAKCGWHQPAQGDGVNVRKVVARPDLPTVPGRAVPEGGGGGGSGAEPSSHKDAQRDDFSHRTTRMATTIFMPIQPSKTQTAPKATAAGIRFVAPTKHLLTDWGRGFF